MTGDDEAGDGRFLERWSRRKTETPAIPPPAPAVEAPPTSDEIEAIVARLPSLDSIATSRDVSAFLARGVPDALRNAALALLWRSDPAVRDRIPDAIDYAENYHAPETIAGWGPAAPGEGQAMVERLHRGLDQVAGLESPPLAEADETSPRPAPVAPDESSPPEAPAVRRSPASEPRPIARRHGGALPGDPIEIA